MTGKIIESLRSELAELQAVGAIARTTVGEFDTLFPLPVRHFTAAEIRKLRESLHISQPVFARHLHTTASTVRKWEQGHTRPFGPALRLLNVIAAKGLQAIL